MNSYAATDYETYTGTSIYREMSQESIQKHMLIYVVVIAPITNHVFLLDVKSQIYFIKNSHANCFQ